jgi:hypothetical protein
LHEAHWPDADPPDLETPLLLIDTTDGYEPAISDMLDWLHRELT